MLKVLNYIFVGLGVVFFIIILIAVYLFIFDPFNLKGWWGLISNPPAALVVPKEETEVDGVEIGAETSVESSPTSNVSAGQAEALKSVGMSAESVNFTDAQIQCFTAILGETRVNEIKAGAVPTMSEFYAVRGCL